MMKKLIKLIMVFVLSLSLIGCGKTYQEATNNIEQNNDVCGGYFTEIIVWNSNSAVYRIVYANDTKVKYFISTSGYRFGITPLYNADGSLQIYEGE